MTKKKTKKSSEKNQPWKIMELCKQFLGIGEKIEIYTDGKFLPEEAHKN